MEFDKLISKKLHPVLSAHGLVITEHETNRVTYVLGELVVVLSHNAREKTNALWVGRKGLNKVEIDDQALKHFFGSDMKIDDLPARVFVDHAYLFFTGDGQRLLTADNRMILRDLIEFNKKRAAQFTSDLNQKQTLEAANRAWKEGKYSEVVRYLKKLDKASLSEATKRKYKISLERSED